MKVGLFVTCVCDLVTPQVGRAAVRLLEAAGCEVEFPPAQTCCGQPAFNSGFPADARRLARHFLSVFEPYEAVVAPSGSCTAMVRQYYPHLFEDDPALKRRAEALGRRVFELTEFLVDVMRRPDVGAASQATVTYHASCHQLRELNVLSQPRAVLAAAGVTVSEMADPERCCGFGGTFSTSYPEVSVPMADAKLDQALAAGAPVLVACDSSCLLHLSTRAQERGLPLECRHLAEVVAEGLG